MPSRRRSRAHWGGVSGTWPWWVGLMLALLSHVGLRWCASQLEPASSAYPLVQAGQYALPILLLSLAAMAAWQRTVRRKLLAEVVPVSDTQLLHQLGHEEFATLVGQAFRLQGYDVVGQGGGAEACADLLLRRGREVFLVQCRQWRDERIGVEGVRQLLGLMAAHEASGGFLVTSGRFRREAHRFVRGRPLRLLDGPALVALLHQVLAERQASVTPSPPAGTPPPSSLLTEPLSQHVPLAMASGPLAGAAPCCPRCGHGMVQRPPQRPGRHPRGFWGCGRYPVCKGTRPLA